MGRVVGWGERREGGGPSLSHRVSWLLCIQQQLWVSAWTHGGTAPSGTACSDHSNLLWFFSPPPLLANKTTDSGVEGGYQNFTFSSEPQAARVSVEAPEKGSGQFRRLFSPPLSLALLPSARLDCKRRNKLISAQRVKLAAARLASPHHGCKVLSVSWWEFYSRRTAEYGFCPLFGLLQLQ